jgi:glyoxylase-like metal-dependent hydrolase (beta-lactamase superfamily II)/rhodanese-related sulfurtransferase
VLFRQFVDDDLGCASYLIGDENEGVAAVIDPAYAIEQYLEEADRQGARIVLVLETHTHADHLSGHGRLALELGIPVAIHAAAEPAYAFEALTDGRELELGSVRIRVLHTPGHRPEHCALAVVDGTRAEEPWLVLTGDSLFVGEAARPDLAVGAREGAEDLYYSLHRLLELSDGVEVYPGHVAGSLCGTGMSSKASTTIGFERRFNPALAPTSVADFIETASTVSALRPPTVERLVELNRGPFVGPPRPLERLDDPGDGVVLDVRSAAEFGRGHVDGAFNVPVSGSSFGTKAGFVLSTEERIVLHAPSAEEAERAARGLRAVGFLDLAGYVLDPATPVRLEPVGLEELERLLAEGDVELVDVREKNERDEGYIPGSRHLPYRLLRACGDTLRNGRTVVTICESGPRAAIAASVLQAQGVDARPVQGGGVADWEADGKQTVTFRRCGR